MDLIEEIRKMKKSRFRDGLITGVLLSLQDETSQKIALNKLLAMEDKIYEHYR